MTNSMLIVIGVIVFLAGGAVLALVPGPQGTAIGTTAGLAGLVLLGWAWIRRKNVDEVD